MEEERSRSSSEGAPTYTGRGYSSLDIYGTPQRDESVQSEHSGSSGSVDQINRDEEQISQELQQAIESPPVSPDEQEANGHRRLPPPHNWRPGKRRRTYESLDSSDESRMASEELRDIHNDVLQDQVRFDELPEETRILAQTHRELGEDLIESRRRSNQAVQEMIDESIQWRWDKQISRYRHIEQTLDDVQIGNCDRHHLSICLERAKMFEIPFEKQITTLMEELQRRKDLHEQRRGTYENFLEALEEQNVKGDFHRNLNTVVALRRTAIGERRDSVRPRFVDLDELSEDGSLGQDLDRGITHEWESTHPDQGSWREFYDQTRFIAMKHLFHLHHNWFAVHPMLAEMLSDVVHAADDSIWNADMRDAPRGRRGKENAFLQSVTFHTTSFVSAVRRDWLVDIRKRETHPIFHDTPMTSFGPVEYHHITKIWNFNQLLLDTVAQIMEEYLPVFGDRILAGERWFMLAERLPPEHFPDNAATRLALQELAYMEDLALDLALWIEMLRHSTLGEYTRGDVRQLTTDRLRVHFKELRAFHKEGRELMWRIIGNELRDLKKGPQDLGHDSIRSAKGWRYLMSSSTGDTRKEIMDFSPTTKRCITKYEMHIKMELRLTQVIIEFEKYLVALDGELQSLEIDRRIWLTYEIYDKKARRFKLDTLKMSRRLLDLWWEYVAAMEHTDPTLYLFENFVDARDWYTLENEYLPNAQTVTVDDVWINMPRRLAAFIHQLKKWEKMDALIRGLDGHWDPAFLGSEAEPRAINVSLPQQDVRFTDHIEGFAALRKLLKFELSPAFVKAQKEDDLRRHTLRLQEQRRREPPYPKRTKNKGIGLYLGDIANTDESMPTNVLFQTADDPAGDE
ncbi:hypothetical protein SLS58_006425 [Diplodia intermedia]|uniref:Uncharacterized protein n=1 Tax=Diplodia intermedia TaxID=856260 RepID=A0ABR3TMY7_9PEZI